MDASGSTREGWMTFVPVTVLLFIVMYVVGGPAQFVNLMAQWSMDAINSIADWFKHL
jgi:hypothetical protein